MKVHARAASADARDYDVPEIVRLSDIGNAKSYTATFDTSKGKIVWSARMEGMLRIWPDSIGLGNKQVQSVLCVVLYYFDRMFTHLVNFGQNKFKRNQKIQKKNILGERFFWL